MMEYATNPGVPLTIGTNPWFAQPAKSPAKLSRRQADAVHPTSRRMGGDSRLDERAGMFPDAPGDFRVAS